jgi:hypothetical protein
MLIQDIVGNHYPFHPSTLYIQVLKERREENEEDKRKLCASRVFIKVPKAHLNLFSSYLLIFFSSALPSFLLFSFQTFF